MDSSEAAIGLKNLDFLVPHLPKLEGDLQALLFEIDQLIEQKKQNWEKDVRILRSKVAENSMSNETRKTVIHDKASSAHESAAFIQNNSNKCNEDNFYKLKSVTDWIHDASKPTREKQMIIQNDATHQRLQQIEKDNTILLSELRNLNENHRTRTEVLASQLNDEKSKNTRLQARCAELESRLNSCAVDLEKERDSQRNLQSLMQLRQSELDILLQKAKCTVEFQANELTNLKQTLADKQMELTDVSSQLSNMKSDSVASIEAVHRLEHVVLKHISLLTTQTEPHNVSFTGRQNHEKNGHLDNLSKSILRLERRLCSALGPLKSKVQELSRLKSACQVASATIRRLTEAKTESTQQTSVARKNLDDVLAKVVGFHETIKTIQNSTNSKLLNTEDRLRRLSHIVNKARSTGLKSKAKLKRSIATQSDSEVSGFSASSQTDGEYTAPADYWPGSKVQVLRNDWLLSVQKLQKQIESLTSERSDLISQLNQQRLRVEDLQKDNLALTDLLTDAEKFNRTRIPCTTEHSVRLFSPEPPERQPDSQPRLQEAVSLRSCSTFDSVNSQMPLRLSIASSMQSTTTVTSTSGSPSHTRDVGTLECEQHPSTWMATASAAALKDVTSSKCLRATPGSLSPVEYKHFVLSNGHIDEDNTESPINGHASTHLDVKSPQTPIHKCCNNQTVNNGGSHVCLNSDVHKMGYNNSAYDHWHDPVQPAFCPRVSEKFTSVTLSQMESHPLSFGSEEVVSKGDGELYALATKFLTDEQQHSLQLERQIDMHLEELKRQMGL